MTNGGPVPGERDELASLLHQGSSARQGVCSQFASARDSVPDEGARAAHGRTGGARARPAPMDAKRSALVDWSEIDDDLLACIFAKLPFRLMGVVSLVCRRWSVVASSPHWKPERVVYAWGSRQVSGLETDARRPMLLEFSLANPIAQIACANSATLALTTDGTVWHWGLWCMKPGVRRRVAVVHEAPTRVPGLTDVVAIACSTPGYYHSRIHYEHLYHCAAVTRDGGLCTWGNADVGQLVGGDGGGGELVMAEAESGASSASSGSGEEGSSADENAAAAAAAADSRASWVRFPARVSGFGGAPPSLSRPSSFGAGGAEPVALRAAPGRAGAAGPPLARRVLSVACGMHWTGLHVHTERLVDERAPGANADEAGGAPAAASATLEAEMAAAARGAEEAEAAACAAADAAPSPARRPSGDAPAAARAPDSDGAQSLLALLTGRPLDWPLHGGPKRVQPTCATQPAQWRRLLGSEAEGGLPPRARPAALLTPDGAVVELRAGGVLVASTLSVETAGRWCTEGRHKLQGWEELSNVPVRQLCAGAFHAAVVTVAGQLLTFGDQIGRDVSNGNLLGQRVEHAALGRGVRPPRRVVDVPSAVAEVAASTYCSVAVTTDGRVFSWGDSDGCALGHDERSCHTPMPISALAGQPVAHASVSYTNGAATTACGEVFVWGGQLWEGGIAKETIAAVAAADGAGEGDGTRGRMPCSPFTSAVALTELEAAEQSSIGLPTAVKWGGVPACYACESVQLAHKHGYLVFHKRPQPPSLSAFDSFATATSV